MEFYTPFILSLPLFQKLCGTKYMQERFTPQPTGLVWRWDHWRTCWVFIICVIYLCVKMASKLDFSQTLRSLNLINIIFNLKKGTGCSYVFSIIWQRYTNSGCIKFRNVVISDILDATDVIILFQLPVGQITVLWITPIICCLLRLRLLRTGAQKYSTWRMNGGMLTVLRKIISYAQCPQCT